MARSARNPWVAMDVATDPVAHARLLSRAHERELLGARTPSADMRELVLSSWRRSIAAARHIVAIGDAAANLLWVSGDPGACERARDMRFHAGAAWSELEAGTNAVGTAAALDHPVQIFSAEHLIEAVHPWTCSAAPIHDPATGELIGVIDLTADLRTNHPHTLSLAALAAGAAETELYLRSLKLAEALRERWETAISGRRTASALLDANGWVIASRGASELPNRLDL